MTSFRLSITPRKRAAGRFVSKVRRELQKAFAEEKVSRGLTQAQVARELGVHRSVINRQLLGVENLTLSRVGEFAYGLGREINFSLSKPEAVVGGNFRAGADDRDMMVVQSTAEGPKVRSVLVTTIVSYPPQHGGSNPIIPEPQRVVSEPPKNTALIRRYDRVDA